jgi:hypothetical protein
MFLKKSAKYKFKTILMYTLVVMACILREPVHINSMNTKVKKNSGSLGALHSQLPIVARPFSDPFGQMENSSTQVRRFVALLQSKVVVLSK